MSWGVIGTSFPADWLADTVLGICDAAACKQNTSGQLWNGTSGSTFNVAYPANATHDSIGDFHLALNLTHTTSTGSYWITVRLRDGALGGTSRNITFVINKAAAAIPYVSNTENDIVLYPNPASSEINVIYNPTADVKNITIYNIIGHVMAVYKVTDNNSANLNLDNVPSGVYFIRLFNSHGDLVVTRKFTKK